MIFDGMIGRYKNIKNEWIRTLLFYLVLYGVVIIPFYFMFYQYHLLYTDINSAYYMLNTLIESLASVLAIVITLSLIAAQLASSASTRVLVIFRKSPDLWILITIYIIAIIYALSVLYIIDVPRLSELQWHLSFIYFISVFAFAALIPYIWDVLMLMNPEKVIIKLGEDITKDSILESIEKESGNIEYTSGPIQPLIDMMNNALLKYQVSVFRIGLETLEKGIIKILERGMSDWEEIEISNYLFINHLDRIAKISLKNKNVVSSSALTKSIYRISKVAIEADQKFIYGYSINLIGDIGIRASKQTMNYPASNCLVYLGQLGLQVMADEQNRNQKYILYLVFSSIQSIFEEALLQDKVFVELILSFKSGIFEGLRERIIESGDEELIRILNTHADNIKNLKY